jgi:hypothetical protein
MPETAEQYIARIRSFIGSNDPVQSLARTPDTLRSTVQGASSDAVKTRPAPSKWSVLEQVVHLSDVEIAVGFRVRLILGSEDGVPIQPFDQDKWQQNLNYNSRDLEPTLAAFTSARENNVRLYRSLTEAQWNKYGIHAERGKETVRDVIVLQAGHDLNHLKQIDEILGTKSAAGSSR